MTTPEQPRFVHPPLASGSRCTRLLKLLPGDSDDAPLHGQLKTIDLDDDDNELSYTALSYTWGSPVFSDNLYFGDGVLPITPNLAAALRHFRRIGNREHMWIDAICINQNDPQEKNEQIPLMVRIYRQASYVQVWLGDDQQTVSLLKNIRATYRLYVNKVEVQPPEKRHDAFLVNLERLSKVSWFSRRWVLQELAANPNVVLCSGRYELPWTHLLQLIHDCGSPQVPKNIQSLSELWESWSMPSRNRLRQSDDILDMLGLFDLWNCTDARDRIFALINLAWVNDLESPDCTHVEVDYKLSVERVYTMFAEDQIHAGFLHKVLDQAIMRRRAGRTALLPSWVPDWRDPYKAKRYKRARYTGLEKLGTTARLKRSDCGKYTVLRAGVIRMRVPLNGLPNRTPFHTPNYIVEPQSLDVDLNEQKVTSFVVIWEGSRSARCTSPPTNQITNEAGAWSKRAAQAIMDMWQFVSKEIKWLNSATEAEKQRVRIRVIREARAHLLRAVFDKWLFKNPSNSKRLQDLDSLDQWPSEGDLESASWEKSIEIMLGRHLVAMDATHEVLNQSLENLFLARQHYTSDIVGYYFVMGVGSSEIRPGDEILSLYAENVPPPAKVIHYVTRPGRHVTGLTFPQGQGPARKVSDRILSFVSACYLSYSEWYGNNQNDSYEGSPIDPILSACERIGWTKIWYTNSVEIDELVETRIVDILLT